MAFYMIDSMPWHEGENQMHKLMHVPSQENPSTPFLSPGAGYMTQQSPLLAIGTLDADGKPWTTVLGGKAGFAHSIGKSVVEINAPVDEEYDPVIEALLSRRGDDVESSQNVKDGSMIGGLAIDLEHRLRVKLYGKVVSGTLKPMTKGYERGKSGLVAQMRLFVHIDESLGNCPKYLNKKTISPRASTPKLISNSPQLPPQAIALLEKADLFFISSSHENQDMDTNHRGGPPGFVRVISNDPSGAVIVYPEYSGNRLYQTLGNLQTTPLAGLAVPDFDTGDVLYLTGQTEVLVGQNAASILPRSNLAVKITITSSRFVQDGLSFRGLLGERSPYNPSVRFATTEKHPGAESTVSSSAAPNYARLIKTERLTPTISRFRFKIQNPALSGPWQPGQYAALDFADDLDMGYSHMRDDDPRSLNDDYTRTFTVSGPPPSNIRIPSTDEIVKPEGRGTGTRTRTGTGEPADEFELTIRRVGRVTDYLFKQAARASRTRGIFEIPLKGFGGEFHFEELELELEHEQPKIMPFIAGGIGITPLLSQLSPSLDTSRLRVLWTISLKDIGLVADTFTRYPELVPVTRVFLTGNQREIETEQDKLSLRHVLSLAGRQSSVESQQNKRSLDQFLSDGRAKPQVQAETQAQVQAQVEFRRLAKEDVDKISTEKGVSEWYMCVGPRLKSSVLNWLAGKRIVYEDFGY